jgi:hypothetical protein
MACSAVIEVFHPHPSCSKFVTAKEPLIVFPNGGLEEMCFLFVCKSVSSHSLLTSAKSCQRGAVILFVLFSACSLFGACNGGGACGEETAFVAELIQISLVALCLSVEQQQLDVPKAPISFSLLMYMIWKQSFAQQASTKYFQEGC